MPLDQEIVDWAASRPVWQQTVLHLLALGGNVDQDQIRTIADALISKEQDAVTPLTLDDMPGNRSAGQTVTLCSISPVEHVNALAGGQVLDFPQSGLTCVYGDNGSGKSGYARLVAQVVRARHREEVLSDIFNDRQTDTPSALIGYAVDGIQDAVAWPADAPTALGQISYFDEACGEAYLSKESAVTYRPAGLLLLDGLITVCDAVRDELDRRLASNNQRRFVMPTLTDGTEIQQFVDGIAAETTVEQLDKACTLPEDAGAAIEALRKKEAALRSSDPGQEARRLKNVADQVTLIADHLDLICSGLGTAAVERLLETQQDAIQLRAAAATASSASFDTEPVSGVGTVTWRALWDAARQFSEAEAYPAEPFPSGSGRCVLCQQELGEEARGRFHRFHLFMTDQTERQATQAEARLDQAVATFRAIETQPTPVALALATLEPEDGALARRCVLALARFDERKTAVLARLADGTTAVPDIPDLHVSDLREQADEIQSRAVVIDPSEFERHIKALTTEQRELEGRQQVATARDDILGEIMRLQEVKTIEHAKSTTRTTGITAKASELTRDYVTAEIRDQFTRESDRLRLKKVTLQDLAGHKGRLMHRPAFLGAQQTADLDAVLSEGEQTALGLAGFLTEAEFDRTKSAIVLDDPVTSLDHVRRPHVARRLCDLAQDRQVIVFTHDVSFVADLLKAAREKNVVVSERCIERRRNGSPGICSNKHPWSAKDARGRLGELRADLARIKRDQGDWDSATYDEKAADWAGRLSETWERIINLDLINRVVTRGSGEVQPAMFKIFARITETDDREFQASYHRVSGWARRHDKRPEASYVSPDVDEMEEALRHVQAWFDRVRKYDR